MSMSGTTAAVGKSCSDISTLCISRVLAFALGFQSWSRQQCDKRRSGGAASIGDGAAKSEHSIEKISQGLEIRRIKAV
jgi:hypothetical protein